MRILFLSARYPFPAHRGDTLRVLHLVRGLATQAQVTLCCFGMGPPLPVARVRVRSAQRRLPSSLLANLRAGDPRLPLQVRLYLDEAMQRLVDEELQDFRPDVVHASTARMAPYLRRAGAAHAHLDLIDSLALNMEQAARRAERWKRAPYRLEARLMERFEATAVAAADSASLVSEGDRRATAGLERASVIPNGVDLEMFPFVSPTDRGAVLLFFGNLGYVHNVAAVRFVVREVLPRVRGLAPGVVLRLAGARPAAAVRRLQAVDGVELAGEVASMADELHQAAVAVLPVLSGSGIKNKVLEAFAAGTPVVANRLSLEGIPGAQDGRHFLRAETAEEIASACVHLLADADLRMRLAEHGLALVRERFAWPVQVRRLLDCYGRRPA